MNNSSTVPVLTIPGKPSYKTLGEVVNEYLANENALMQLAMQKSAPIRTKKLRKSQNLKPDGIRWTVTMDPIELTDGYILDYECYIVNSGYMTLIPIAVSGNPDKTLVFIEDVLIKQLKIATKMDLSNLLQLNVTMDISHSKIKTDVVKNEVIWEFYGGKVTGRIEQGYYVFHRLLQCNITPVSEFVKYLNKLLHI